MKTYGVVEVYFHAFLTSTLDEVGLSGSLPGRFTLYRLDRRLGGPKSGYEEQITSCGYVKQQPNSWNVQHGV
jgi:hypothetical protein